MGFRLRIVSNFGHGNCGAGEIHTRARAREISRRRDAKGVPKIRDYRQSQGVWIKRVHSKRKTLIGPFLDTCWNNLATVHKPLSTLVITSTPISLLRWQTDYRLDKYQGESEGKFKIIFGSAEDCLSKAVKITIYSFAVSWDLISMLTSIRDRSTGIKYCLHGTNRLTDWFVLLCVEIKLSVKVEGGFSRL